MRMGVTAKVIWGVTVRQALLGAISSRFLWRWPTRESLVHKIWDRLELPWHSPV